MHSESCDCLVFRSACFGVRALALSLMRYPPLVRVCHVWEVPGEYLQREEEAGWPQGKLVSQYSACKKCVAAARQQPFSIPKYSK